MIYTVNKTVAMYGVPTVRKCFISSEHPVSLFPRSLDTKGDIIPCFTF